MRHAFGERFDIRPGYLNTASIDVPPVRSAERMVQTIAEWRTGAAQPVEFDADVHAARAAWAQLVGVPVDSVAVGSAVSQLTGLVAASIPDGAPVLVVRGEFTSVTFPFAAHTHRGVVVNRRPRAARCHAGGRMDAARTGMG